jgi:hypothetical protein
VVAELGVADHIDDAPVGVEQLAAQCAADADALDRLLRLLVAHDVFRYEDGAYAHTDASRLLRSDHPMSMRAFPRMMGLPAVWSAFAHLEHSLRTGAPALEKVEPAGFWRYLQDHPQEAALFGEAMQAKAAADIAAILGAYDFTRFGSVADVGGGRGHLLRAVLESSPTTHGVLFDLPEVIDTLDDDTPRLTLHAGDFFVDPLPKADAYLLMEIVHDWADAEAVAILSAIRRAAPPGSTVLIVEGVVDEAHADVRVQTLDVVMLAITGGRERSPAQLATLLDRSGLQLRTVLDTSGPLRIVEAGVAD